MKKKTISLLENPNVGKTSLFKRIRKINQNKKTDKFVQLRVWRNW